MMPFQKIGFFAPKNFPIYLVLNKTRTIPAKQAILCLSLFRDLFIGIFVS